MPAPDSLLVATGGRTDDDDVHALALRARTDPRAFEAIYRRYVGRIHGFVMRRSGSRQLADEVTAATFERAWRAMPRFEWQGGGIEPWLFRIASTELASICRREARVRRPRAQPALQALTGSPVTTVDERPDDAGVDALRDALSTLPQRYQQALALRFFSGLSNEDAAQAMDCSRSVMAVTVHRAINALRRAMAVAEEGP
ncbi:MAG TPA: sigma-70 family RNA polymerase sigma factor [Acidimicrobiales bacterium]|nr:sigma-70 family RNA polymerase sigma factor [Acidimicrobiales bacterium]